MNKNKEKVLKRVPIAENNICIKRDDKKCINCGACKGICMSRIGVFGHYDMQHENIRCINCGQCSLICPTGSISEVLDYKKVIKDIENDKDYANWLYKNGDNTIKKCLNLILEEK